MAQKPSFLSRIRRFPLPFLIISICLVGFLVGISTWVLVSSGQHTPPQQGGTATIPSSPVAHTTPVVTKGTTVSEPVSPLIFGTNLGLFDTNDQVLNSSATRNLLQQMHVRIIRMPTRKAFSTAVELQAAQAIKSIGAVPLIVLRGAQDPNLAGVIADDTRMITAINQVFGNTPVYYEFGNEDDLNGVPIQDYTSRWNTVIPQLKRLAPKGDFIGPVSYQYSHDNLTAFLQAATPRPDAISWHEYTCSLKDPSDKCLSGIDRWTIHISDARAVLQATLKTVLPIMITEWNYAPDQQILNTGQAIADGKYNNTQFMSTWTTKALQTLAANRVFASMQYSCTNTALPLVAPNSTITPQGQTFQVQYQQVIVSGKQPAPIAGTAQQTPVPTTSTGNNGTVTLNGPQAFSFEDGGTDGWSTHGSGITNLQNSANLALDGTHSLQATLSNSSGGDFPYAAVSLTNQANPPQAGQMLTAYVYLSSDSVNINAKLFTVDNSYHWSTSNNTALVPGTWTKVTFTIPATNGQIRQLGIQFNNPSGSNISCNVYIDAISWS